MLIYYFVTFGISLLFTLLYVLIWHKHFDAHISLIFAFIPMANLAYAMMAHARIDAVASLIQDMNVRDRVYEMIDGPVRRDCLKQ